MGEPEPCCGHLYLGRVLCFFFKLFGKEQRERCSWSSELGSEWGRITLASRQKGNNEIHDRGMAFSWCSLSGNPNSVWRLHIVNTNILPFIKRI